MNKTVIICATVALFAVLASVLACAVVAPSPYDHSPPTGDMNLYVILPIMLAAVFLICVIIKHRKE